jgi:hypothetical protein
MYWQCLRNARTARTAGTGTASRLLVLFGPGRQTSPLTDRTNDAEVTRIGPVVGVLLVGVEGQIEWNVKPDAQQDDGQASRAVPASTAVAEHNLPTQQSFQCNVDCNLPLAGHYSRDPVFASDFKVFDAQPMTYSVVEL